MRRLKVLFVALGVMCLLILCNNRTPEWQATAASTMSDEDSPPCQSIGGNSTTSGNCTITSYMLTCDGPAGGPLGGQLYACSSTGCELPGGGFSISVICHVIDPGVFVSPILT